jgi:hypothetical protein
MNCETTCPHGLPCTDHAVKRWPSEVPTHVADSDFGQHRFWHGTGGWHCVVLTADDLAHMMPTESEAPA